MRGRGGGVGSAGGGLAAPQPMQSSTQRLSQRTRGAWYGRDMTHARVFFVAFLVLVGVGCSSPPVNVAGTYSVSLTNDANGCMFPNWTGSTPGVPLEITQNGTAATATVMGLAATEYDYILGSHVFAGNVSGSHMDFIIHGTVHDACGATLDAHATVELVGDALTSGVVTYSYANLGATCESYKSTCTSTQLFNGTRPPTR